MISINKTKLILSLERMRTKLCAYIKQPCDCKFIEDDTRNDLLCRGFEQGSGCPEISLIIRLLSVMTDEEYKSISNRKELPKKNKKTSKNKKQKQQAPDLDQLQKTLTDMVNMFANGLSDNLLKHLGNISDVLDEEEKPEDSK